MPNGTKVVPAPAATDALRAGTGAEASSEPEVDPLTHYVRERRVRANPCKVDGGRVWSNDDMVVRSAPRCGRPERTLAIYVGEAVRWCWWSDAERSDVVEADRDRVTPLAGGFASASTPQGDSRGGISRIFERRFDREGDSHVVLVEASADDAASPRPGMTMTVRVRRRASESMTLVEDLARPLAAALLTAALLVAAGFAASAVVRALIDATLAETDDGAVATDADAADSGAGAEPSSYAPYVAALRPVIDRVVERSTPLAVVGALVFAAFVAYAAYDALAGSLAALVGAPAAAHRCCRCCWAESDGFSDERRAHARAAIGACALLLLALLVASWLRHVHFSATLSAFVSLIVREIGALTAQTSALLLNVEALLGAAGGAPAAAGGGGDAAAAADGADVLAQLRDYVALVDAYRANGRLLAVGLSRARVVVLFLQFLCCCLGVAAAGVGALFARRQLVYQGLMWIPLGLALFLLSSAFTAPLSALLGTGCDRLGGFLDGSETESLPEIVRVFAQCAGNGEDAGGVTTMRFLQDALRDAFDEINAMRVPLDHEPFVLHINGSAFVAGLGQSSEEEHAGLVVYLGSTLMAAASAVGASANASLALATGAAALAAVDGAASLFDCQALRDIFANLETLLCTELHGTLESIEHLELAVGLLLFALLFGGVVCYHIMASPRKPHRCGCCDRKFRYLFSKQMHELILLRNNVCRLRDQDLRTLVGLFGRSYDDRADRQGRQEQARLALDDGGSGPGLRVEGVRVPSKFAAWSSRKTVEAAVARDQADVSEKVAVIEHADRTIFEIAVAAQKAGAVGVVAVSRWNPSLSTSSDDRGTAHEVYARTARITRADSEAKIDIPVLVVSRATGERLAAGTGVVLFEGLSGAQRHLMLVAVQSGTTKPRCSRTRVFALPSLNRHMFDWLVRLRVEIVLSYWADLAFVAFESALFLGAFPARRAVWWIAGGAVIAAVAGLYGTLDWLEHAERRGASALSLALVGACALASLLTLREQAGQLIACGGRGAGGDDGAAADDALPSRADDDDAPCSYRRQALALQYSAFVAIHAAILVALAAHGLATWLLRDNIVSRRRQGAITALIDGLGRRRARRRANEAAAAKRSREATVARDLEDRAEDARDDAEDARSRAVKGAAVACAILLLAVGTGLGASGALGDTDGAARGGAAAAAARQAAASDAHAWRGHADDDGAAAAAAFADCNGHAALCARRLDEVAFAGAHNAMSSVQEGWALANNYWSASRALEAGVFALNLDVHYDAGGEAYLCHGLCALGRRRVADALAELAAFVARERGVVVQIALESYVAPADAAALLNASALAPYLHAQSEGAPWPTLAALVAARARVVVLANFVGAQAAYESAWRGGAAPAWLLPYFRFAAETPFACSAESDFGCAADRGALDSGAAFRPLYVVNHFLTDPVPNPVLAKRANRRESLEAHARACVAHAGRAPNVLNVDYWSVGSVVDVVGELNGVGSAPS